MEASRKRPEPETMMAAREAPPPLPTEIIMMSSIHSNLMKSHSERDPLIHYDIVKLLGEGSMVSLCFDNLAVQVSIIVGLSEQGQKERVGSWWVSSTRICPAKAPKLLFSFAQFLSIILSTQR